MLTIPPGDVDVRLFDRIVNIENRQTELVEPVGIQVDVYLPGTAAGHIRCEHLRYQGQLIGNIFGQAFEQNGIHIADHGYEHDGNVTEADFRHCRIFRLFGQLLLGIGHFFPDPLQGKFQIRIH